jgi:hypothetical protein
MTLKTLTRKLGLLAVLGLTSAAALAQQTKTVDFGQTTVQLSSTFTNALQSLQVSLGTVSPTHVYFGTASFPVTGGALDLDTAAGNILHSGGLTLEAGGIEVSLQSFIIDTTGSKPVLTGLVAVNNKLLGRLPLFNLALPPGVTLPLQLQGGFILQLDNVGVTLSPQAAAALNAVYSIKAFKAGLDIGTANVFAIVTP